MKILFAGDMRSPFIRQDYEILKDIHIVELFDLSIHARSFWQVPVYLFKSVVNADVVWIWFADYPAVPFILRAKMAGVPVVVCVGGWEVCAMPEIGYGNQLSTIRGAVSRWVIRNATINLTMSDAYHRRIKDLVPEAAVIKIPGCVVAALCDTPPPEKHGVITAYCGDTEVLKGIQTFKDATVGMGAKVIKNVPHATLMDALLHAKVYCQLSYTESFGMTVLEAMACGCVPVVSDRDALPELVGDVGVIAPYGDADKTFYAILTALDMDGGLARERAKEFSTQQRFTEIEALLERLPIEVMEE